MTFQVVDRGPAADSFAPGAVGSEDVAELVHAYRVSLDLFLLPTNLFGLQDMSTARPYFAFLRRPRRLIGIENQSANLS